MLADYNRYNNASHFEFGFFLELKRRWLRYLSYHDQEGSLKKTMIGGSFANTVRTSRVMAEVLSKATLAGEGDDCIHQRQGIDRASTLSDIAVDPHVPSVDPVYPCPYLICI